MYCILLLPLCIHAQHTGIGGISTQSTLQISHSGNNTTPHLVLNDSAAGNGEYLRLMQKNSTNNWSVISALNHSVLQIKNSSEPDALLSMKSNGYVGINNNDPSNIFHVNSAGPVAAILNGGVSSYFTWGENNNTLGYMGSYAGTGGDVDFGTVTGNTTGNINLLTRGQIRMQVKNNGYVGIGTVATAQQALSIGGGLLIDFANAHTQGRYSTLGYWIPGNTENSIQFGTTGGVKIGSDRFGYTNTYNHWINFYVQDSAYLQVAKDALFIGQSLGSGIIPPGLYIDGDLWADTLLISRGSLYKKINGSFTAGNSNTDSKEVTIFFGHTFAKAPVVNLTLHQDDNPTYSDTFAANIKQIFTDHMVVKIVRIDNGAAGNGWGQSLRLDWVAIDE